MYGVLLAAAMTTGTATPAWGCHGRGCYVSCGHCSGIYAPSGANAFTYSGCGGCSGYMTGWANYGCGGCWGGCYSGCYGGGGCWGGCYGGGGGCHGCSSWGGGGCYAGWICAGGGYATSACSGCGGLPSGYLGFSGSGVWFGCAGGAVPAATTPAAPEKLKEAPKGDGKPKGGSVTAPAGARVTVRLPADAKLYVDNVSCPLTSSVRTFDTPGLEPGRQYFYELRAVVSREGRDVTESKRVIVEAGRESAVDFGEMRDVRTAQR